MAGPSSEGGIEAVLFEIDPNSPIPIYHQLKSAIKNEIEAGKLDPGERIPTEQDLCERLGISRTPVRQALKELVYEGLLIRRRGLGTFVADHAPTDTPSAITMCLMASDSRRASVIERAVGRWNEANPHKQVVLRITLTEHNELHRALSTAVAEGTAPDVAMIDCVWIAEFANAGFLIPLDELDADWMHNEYANKPYPAFIEANYFGRHFYGLQVEGDLSLLWYRKDWFTAQGLQPPTDWNELLAAAQHFARLGVRQRYGLGPYPLAFPGGRAGGEATVYNLLPFLWSAGGVVFKDGYVSLDSAASRSAVRFVGELVNQRAVVPSEVINWKPEDVPRRVARGEAAMALGGSYETVTILEESNWDEVEFSERIDCCLPPAAPGGEPVATAGGISYVVLRQSRHPKLMMDVLKLAVDRDLSAGFGITTRPDSPTSPSREMFGHCVFPLSSKASRLFGAARARPSTPEYFKVSKQLQTMFESVIKNTASAERAVRRAAEFIGAITGLSLR